MERGPAKKERKLMKTRIQQILFVIAIATGCQRVAVAQLTIDDFSTGAYKKTLSSSSDDHTVTGTMIGGERKTYFRVCQRTACPVAENEFAQSATFQTRPGKKAGVPSSLIMSSGYKTFPLIQVFWGIDGQNNIVPLHRDLRPYDRLRVSFDGLNEVLNLNLQLYTPMGNGQIGCNLLPVPPVQFGQPPYTVDFPLVDFTLVGGTTIDFSDITYMDMLSFLGGSYAITKYEAVPASTPRASFTCTGH
jgi:hypothetical protein